jgi:signal transduction histidine kinase
MSNPPLRRIPIESTRPIVIFAWARLALTLISIALVTALGVPDPDRLAVVIGVLAVSWSLGNLLLARRSPTVAVSPVTAVVDVAVLMAIQVAVPETYGAVRFMAIAFLAIHAHFQGERLGLAVALVAVAGLVGVSAAAGAGDVDDRLLVFYEFMFACAALATTALVGGFRTSESASRLRARELTRRTMRREGEIRRQVAEALHDGPVQEMIGLDMALSAARNEAEREGAPATMQLLEEAREMSARNVRSLRDEMIDLGPHAFKEMTFGAALERCLPVWERRYGLQTELHIDVSELPSQTEGDLFRIAQEAVMNAVKHGPASHVSISLTSDDGEIELSIADDGAGFGGVDPLESSEPGHIGLASMRERAELLHGSLLIESSDRGTVVRVRAPMPHEAAPS